MYTPAVRAVAQERVNDLAREAEHRRLFKAAVRERSQDRRAERRGAATVPTSPTSAANASAAITEERV